MSYNQYMSEDKKKKQYSREEIKEMSYWQTWELRRESGLMYYTFMFALYTFMIYCFIKIILILKYADTLKFTVDLWMIPVFFLTGPAFYYFHEWYYKNIYLKK